MTENRTLVFMISTIEIQIKTQNEILPYELENFPDRDFYRNIGKTTRMGIELFWEHQKGPWEWTLSYNYASLKFDNYILKF